MTEAIRVKKANHFEDFEVGQTFEHHWGRTLNRGDNSTFTTATMNSNPTYFNKEYAESLGYDTEVIDPLLAFNTVVGLSVQDLSEAGGAFLEVSDLEFHEPVYPGDTLYARSEVLEHRESESRPNQGIVTWHTTGLRGDDVVLEFDRTNLVNRAD